MVRAMWSWMVRPWKPFGTAERSSMSSQEEAYSILTQQQLGNHMRSPPKAKAIATLGQCHVANAI
ncbi:hypothetical protein CFAM422_004321 [Trichoderma lentiforme]|uniref:Uncharacterized protein n=1 Tax=Trichoderma lentiforme TaxID=1567552 RepID=A0A9P5CGR5_9HYPO|nr:hypothetical protein CFAM422_004321 [Trichoderma lentiforme]